MTKTELRKAIREVKNELFFLHGMEEIYSPDWRFTATKCSKRRNRLLKTFQALNTMQSRRNRHA